MCLLYKTIGEVMVIVEYCRFGNLQNFLVKHREYFIDQIVRDKDIIDPSILTKDQRWSNDSGYAYYNRYYLFVVWSRFYLLLSVYHWPLNNGLTGAKSLYFLVCKHYPEIFLIQACCLLC